MKRPHGFRRTSLGVAAAALSAVALLAGLLFLGTGPLEAQAPAPITFSLSQTDTADGTFEVTVEFSPGDEVVGALSGNVVYDSAQMTATECLPVQGAGSCNANDAGLVQFSIFNPSSFDAGSLITVTFESSGAAQDGLIELSMRAVAGLNGEPPAQPPIIESTSDLSPEVISGQLTGVVTASETGEGLFNTQVCATNVADAPEQVDVLEECSSTNGLGNFTFADLPVGEYAVTVTDESGLYASAQQAAVVTALNAAVLVFELDSASSPDAQPTLEVDPPAVPSLGTPPTDDAVIIAPSPGTPPTDDAVIVAPSPGTPPTDDAVIIAPSPGTPPTTSPVQVAASSGTITGTVTDLASDGPIFGVTVCATMPLIGTTECALTSLSGEYQISGLPTSNYIVTASDTLQRFTGDDDVFVGVFEGTTVSGVDFSLTPRG